MKNVIITGAAGNLGKIICRQFINDGYRVIAILGLQDKFEATFDADQMDIHKVDLSSEVEVQQLCDELCNLYNNIEIAVFLAGGFASGNVSDSGKEQLDIMYKLNFETAYFFSRQLFLHMQKQGRGRLFFIGARPALDASAAVSMLPYALSKSLILKLSEIYNAAGRKNGIVSHVIIPSTIDTPANRKSMPDSDYSKWVAPEKIAKTILFACSDDGSALRHGVFKLYGDS